MERLEKAANFIFIVGALVCVSQLIYALNRHLWIDAADFTNVLGAILYISLPALVAALLLCALRLRGPLRIKLALLCFSAGVSLYGVELFLAIADPGSFIWGQRENVTLGGIRPGMYNWEKREVVNLAKKYGVRFDTRTKGELIIESAQKGVMLVPAIDPLLLLKERADGSLTSEITIDGAEVLPLAGISRKLTVFCNESGEYVMLESDEHGFHNPQGAWGSSRMDIAAVGDSFTNGMCVPSDKNFVALIRKQYPNTLNLGMQGEGPVTELATVKEYLPFVRPKLVLWFYYEENDLLDLKKEMTSPLLMNYLTKNFTQGLFVRQTDIDHALGIFINTALDGWRAESSKGIMDEIVRSARYLRFATMEFIKLANMRERVGLVFGKSNTGEPVDSRSLTDQEAEVFRNVLLEAKATVSMWGGKLYFIYLPSRDRFGNPKLAIYHRERVLALVRAVGLPLIDIAGAFEAQDDPLSLFPFRRMIHYNEAGHKLVAEEVLRSISQ
jgi:hypothetical protein